MAGKQKVTGSGCLIAALIGLALYMLPSLMTGSVDIGKIFGLLIWALIGAIILLVVKLAGKARHKEEESRGHRGDNSMRD